MFHDIELASIDFVKSNVDLFERVQKDYQNTSELSHTQYTCLDYKKILSEMREYLQGYYECDDKDQYKYKLIRTTKNFFDAMFTEKRYRRTFVLSEYPEINKEYLEETKKLQDLMQEKLKDESDEDHTMLQLVNNQYRKLSKVCADDMKIVLWLKSLTSISSICFSIDSDLRLKYGDDSTPVIHKKA